MRKKNGGEGKGGEYEEKDENTEEPAVGEYERGRVCERRMLLRC